MIEANIFTAVGTVVIASATVIGVLSTLVYYLTVIESMKKWIILLISLAYLTGVLLCISYTKIKVSL